MNRFRPASRPPRWYLRAGGTLVIGAVLIFFTPIRSHVEGAVIAGAQPMFRFVHMVDSMAVRLRGNFAAKQSLVDENTNLKAQVVQMQADLLDRSVLARENDQLRLLMGRESPPKGVLAEVLVSAGYAPYDTLILDVGADKHIQVGDRVVVDDASIIGTITSVYPTSAKATLFSSPGVQVDGILAGSDIFVTARGQGGGMFDIMLPRDTPLSVGDVVLVPATSRILGVVGSITMGTTDPFKKVLLRSPINPGTVRFVRVVSATP
ncbi:MAG: rod shape-determining protein MreC [Minisyncoccota bacterium]